MKSRPLSSLTLLLLLGLAIWAFFPLFGDYDDANDAPFEISKVELERDYSDYWLTITLKGEVPSEVGPDFGLVTPSGTLIRGVENNEGSLPTRFWINAKELKEPLQLRLQGQTIQVKRNSGLPEIESGDSRLFRKSDWSQ